MEEKSYPFSRGRIDFRYEFVSISSKKEVKKVVLFSEIRKNIYNLALFDTLQDGVLSDISETKNEDLVTVMATVLEIINDFLSENPDYIVVFRGSEEKRQRLYRIIINRELPKMIERFEIFGSVNGKLVFFEPNTEYDYFLIQKI